MSEAKYIPLDNVPLPPAGANVHTTVCDYCIVGCGFKVYTWPVDSESGGPERDQNAFGTKFPGRIRGPWVSPNQHNVASVNGQSHHVVIVPDFDSKVVNTDGNYSIRGGTLALKVYNPDTPTRERLQYPQIRVNGQLTRVDWDTALDVMAAVSKHVLANYGESAWAMKTYSYGYFENTYAISKLAFVSVGTPAFSEHDKPGPGADTAGVDDSGIITFSASYQDWADSEVIFLSGTDPYETKTVVFTSWMMGEPEIILDMAQRKAPPKLIMVLPRRTAGVDFAEKHDGQFVQIIPGTDTLLHLAISRLILESGWEDKEFIEEWIASNWEIEMGMGRGTRNTPWQWRTTWGQFGTGFAGYKEWLLAYEPAALDNAAQVTGVPAADIRRIAETLTGAGGTRPKASFGFEKGNYWSNNYLNTASFAA
ncbi:MAG: molybdopterin-dependent oxidoreductase, partial [Chloroflexota bacterium]